MVESSASMSGRVFISYRRQDTSHLAGRLYDHLANRFGDAQVFMDIDSIEPGMDFTVSIARAVGACDVLLALIGPQWLTATDEEGQRRLDDPQDVVRLEINNALARGIRVIPILVDGVPMPRQQSLPDDLAPLVVRQAVPVRYGSFRSDTDHLVGTIEKTFPNHPTSAGIPVVQPPGIPRAWRANGLVIGLLFGLVVGMAGGLATYVFTGQSGQNMFAAPFATEQVTIVRLLVGGLVGGLARRRPLGHAWWVAALVFGLAVVALLVAGVLSDVIGVEAVATGAEFGLVGEVAGVLAQLIHRRSSGYAWWVGALIGVLVFELTTGLIGELIFALTWNLFGADDDRTQGAYHLNYGIVEISNFVGVAGVLIFGLIVGVTVVGRVNYLRSR